VESGQENVVNKPLALSGLLCLSLLTACGGGPIELVGTYTTSFGMETISEETWDNGFTVTTIEDWDNNANWAVLKNPADDMFFPEKHSKVVWTEVIDGKFHYCTVDFGLDTVEAARTSTKSADASEPGAGGCGGFPWTAMSR